MPVEKFLSDIIEISVFANNEIIAPQNEAQSRHFSASTGEHDPSCDFVMTT